MKKNILKIIACISVIAIIAVCFTGCGKFYANEIKVSDTELTVKVGETAFYAYIANYEDNAEGELVLDINSTDEDFKITETVDVGMPTESSTWVESDGDNETTITNLDLGDGVYVFVEDEYKDIVTVEALGDDLIKFIKDNYKDDGNQALYISAVKAIGAGTETQTITSGDLSATITITVTE